MIKSVAIKATNYLVWSRTDVLALTQACRVLDPDKIQVGRSKRHPMASFPSFRRSGEWAAPIHVLGKTLQ